MALLASSFEAAVTRIVLIPLASVADTCTVSVPRCHPASPKLPLSAARLGGDGSSIERSAE
jgi:hypothetical protein